MKRILLGALVVFVLLILTAARQWRGMEECTPHHWLCTLIPHGSTYTDGVHIKNEGTVTHGISLQGSYTNDIYMQNGNSIANDAADTVTINADIDATGGYVHQVDYWYQDNVAASQTDVVLNMAGDASRSEIPSILPGSIVGIAVYSNGARTNGTLTVDATIDGVATGLQAVLDATNTQTHTATQVRNTDAFTAGQRLGVFITTDALWAPVTADIVVSLLIEQ
jgi:hypothetical protein